MARHSTRTKVHDAVLSLAREDAIGSITMEGVAARARVSKQTLYNSWSSTGEIVFDALLARSADESGAVAIPDANDLSADLHELATATIAELTSPDLEPLLRAVTAEIQRDAELARQYREQLLAPQLAAIAERFRRAGTDDPDGLAELFVGPILHRWLLRTHPFDSEWVSAHVGRVIRAASHT